jgi:hypothetical protein
MASLGAQVYLWLTGTQDSATAIARGQAVVFNSVTDATKMVLATSTGQDKFAGVAYEAAAGQNKDFRVVRGGICLVKANGTIVQGEDIQPNASGGFTTRAAAATGTVVIAGIAMESGVSGDLLAADISPIRFKLS